MAEEQQKPQSAASFISEIHRSVRQELDREYEQRLKSAHEQVIKAQDIADAQRICSARTEEEMAARMAEYRRGRWYHLGAIVASATTGLAMGYAAQRAVDLRVLGMPAMAIGGVPGVAGGVLLNEDSVAGVLDHRNLLAMRASLAAGGTMFSIGTFLYARTHPLPEGESQEKPV